MEIVENLPQLKQRLSIRYRLTAMTEQETKEYIQHRLTVAGASRELFTESAYAEVYALSRGMPRSVNNVCDLALLTGFLGQSEIVHDGIISKVREDLDLTHGSQE